MLQRQPPPEYQECIQTPLSYAKLCKAYEEAYEYEKAIEHQPLSQNKEKPVELFLDQLIYNLIASISLLKIKGNCMISDIAKGTHNYYLRDRVGQCPLEKQNPKTDSNPEHKIKSVSHPQAIKPGEDKHQAASSKGIRERDTCTFNSDTKQKESATQDVFKYLLSKHKMPANYLNQFSLIPSIEQIEQCFFKFECGDQSPSHPIKYFQFILGCLNEGNKPCNPPLFNEHYCKNFREHGHTFNTMTVKFRLEESEKQNILLLSVYSSENDHSDGNHLKLSLIPEKYPLNVEVVVTKNHTDGLEAFATGCSNIEITQKQMYNELFTSLTEVKFNITELCPLEVIFQKRPDEPNKKVYTYNADKKEREPVQQDDLEYYEMHHLIEPDAFKDGTVIPSATQLVNAQKSYPGPGWGLKNEMYLKYDPDSCYEEGNGFSFYLPPAATPKGETLWLYIKHMTKQTEENGQLNYHQKIIIEPNGYPLPCEIKLCNPIGAPEETFNMHELKNIETVSTVKLPSDATSNQ